MCVPRLVESYFLVTNRAIIMIFSWRAACLVWVLRTACVQSSEEDCRTSLWSLHLLMRTTQTGLFELCLHAAFRFRQAAVTMWVANSHLKILFFISILTSCVCCCVLGMWPCILQTYRCTNGHIGNQFFCWIFALPVNKLAKLGILALKAKRPI